MPAARKPAVLSEAVLREALRDCYHPELSLSLIDLGAVEAVALAIDPSAPGTGISGVPPHYRTRIELVLPPAAHDATNSQIAAIVHNRLAAFEQISAAEILLLESPAWSPERMTPEARDRVASAQSAQKHGLIQIH